jgi:hypothetical protein
VARICNWHLKSAAEGSPDEETLVSEVEIVDETEWTTRPPALDLWRQVQRQGGGLRAGSRLAPAPSIRRATTNAFIPGSALAIPSTPAQLFGLSGFHPSPPCLSDERSSPN